MLIFFAIFIFIVVDIGRSTTMKIFTPFTVLLFVLNTNALPYQSDNGIVGFDQDVDEIDFPIDQNGIEITNERIGRERSIPIPSGTSSERRDNGKNFKFVKA